MKNLIFLLFLSCGPLTVDGEECELVKDGICFIGAESAEGVDESVLDLAILSIRLQTEEWFADEMFNFDHFIYEHPLTVEYIPGDIDDNPHLRGTMNLEESRMRLRRDLKPNDVSQCFERVYVFGHEFLHFFINGYLNGDMRDNYWHRTTPIFFWSMGEDSVTETLEYYVFYQALYNCGDYDKFIPIP